MNPPFDAELSSAHAEPSSQQAGDARPATETAADQLIHLFYPELRRIAAARMINEDRRHTWQPTALLNELYLELRKVRTLRPVQQDDADGKAAFIGFAATLMRRLLIHHARPKSNDPVQDDVESIDGKVSSFESLKEMELMLERLGKLDPLLQDVVQLKVFEGLTVPEIAERLGCSVRSVARYWNFARHWLQREMRLV